MGDLQDTVNLTNVDNQNNTPRKQHDRGVLKWCLNRPEKMVSIGYEDAKTKGKRYLTRAGTVDGLSSQVTHSQSQLVLRLVFN